MVRPCDFACAAGPASDSTEARRLDTAASTTAAPTASTAAFSCARVGASSATSRTPTAAAASAPREKLRYRPRPRGAAPAAAAILSREGRSWSPATRTHRTRPMAASAPMAFQ